jgi:hypothetical protein
MTDFNPIIDDKFHGRVEIITEGMYADVYSFPSLTPLLADEFDLTPLAGILDYVYNAIPIGEDFDTTDGHVRGPYDISQVNRFFRDSGLRDVVTVYEDDEGNFYVYINTD